MTVLCLLKSNSSLVSAQTLADTQRFSQAEANSSFSRESDFFFAGCISGGGASGCADCGADQCALASTGKRTNQCAATCSSTNKGEITVFVAAAFHKNAGRLNRDIFSIEIQR